MHQNINNFLENFKQKILQEEDFKEFIISFLKKEKEIDIKKEDISLVNNVIKISSDPYIKTEIYIIKEKLLSILKDRYSNKNIKDII